MTSSASSQQPAAASGTETPGGSAPSIVFEHVTKTYPDGTTAIDDLSLEVPAGSLTAFVGPSGCGKTTSMRMINRMVTPTSGRILVGGQDIAGQRPTALRRSMGYVLQDAGLFPHLTALDNVAALLRLDGRSKGQAREGAEAALRLVRLYPELDRRYPAQLSGGQQQRVGVARALAADPPVLLMDEPFSAVDPVVRGELQQELIRLRGQLSQTIVFVTHDIDEALLLGDRLAVFGPGGRLHQFATGREILTDPADAFVAEMVGRDRGFRALGFEAAEVPVTPPLPGPDPALVRPAAEVAGEDWALRLDAESKPVRWEGPAGSVIVGTLCHRGGDLRLALDSVLSSPAGPGIAVDEAGAFAGFIDRTAVLARIDTTTPAGGGRPGAADTEV
ncbi:ATP-binding cassette domain-containing protein [Brevibacterium sp. BRM-1]|uniref:ABC transporter ATP-binding protein n=1 Tax=Brevibacterium sp. BRM-1 TaxID=2999062 RepID=UPI002281790D|nr:ATP-binding cassette domain-containing protein [Brevibacterium sp. BRM-1]WAL40582.1 ATP-binding cassette domain-containing protein [Brevibacterium sp. BRM-1]